MSVTQQTRIEDLPQSLSDTAPMHPRLLPIDPGEIHQKLAVTRKTRLHELPDLVSVPESCRDIGIGRSLGYDLVRSGEVASVRLGRRVMVPRHAIEKLLGVKE